AGQRSSVYPQPRPAARIPLSISLNDPFVDGYCYKLVSAIIPVPAEVVLEPEAPMDREEAAWIIDALARGVDPYSGEPLPAGGPLANPDTVKALCAALTALRDGGGTVARALRELSENAGKAWDVEEDNRLATAYDAGQTMKALAVTHG